MISTFALPAKPSRGLDARSLATRSYVPDLKARVRALLLDDFLRQLLRSIGLLSRLYSLAVTMSHKSSLVQTPNPSHRRRRQPIDSGRWTYGPARLCRLGGCRPHSRSEGNPPSIVTEQASEFFSDHLLQHHFVQAQVSRKTPQTVVLLLQLTQLADLRRHQTIELILPPIRGSAR